MSNLKKEGELIRRNQQLFHHAHAMIEVNFVLKTKTLISEARRSATTDS